MHQIPGTNCQDLSKECSFQSHRLSCWQADRGPGHRPGGEGRGEVGLAATNLPHFLQSLLTEQELPAPPRSLFRSQNLPLKYRWNFEEIGELGFHFQGQIHEYRLCHFKDVEMIDE